MVVPPAFVKKYMGKHSTEEWFWALAMLAVALLIDAIGTLSFAIPGVGEFADVLWAPFSAIAVKTLFGSTFFAGINLIEELLPGLDFIPTATIAWGSKYHSYASLLLKAAGDLQKISNKRTPAAPAASTAQAR